MNARIRKLEKISSVEVRSFANICLREGESENDALEKWAEENPEEALHPERIFLTIWQVRSPRLAASPASIFARQREDD